MCVECKHLSGFSYCFVGYSNIFHVIYCPKYLFIFKDPIYEYFRSMELKPNHEINEFHFRFRNKLKKKKEEEKNPETKNICHANSTRSIAGSQCALYAVCISIFHFLFSCMPSSLSLISLNCYAFLLINNFHFEKLQTN